MAERSIVRVVSGVPSGSTSHPLHSTRTIRDLLVPMRDGIALATDLVRPNAPGPFPVVLMRTPYDKVRARASPIIENLARRGYAVALQDVRGRFNSDGAFDPYRQEHHDGFDAVEWVAAQSWCDGNVGMIGGSYIGQTQWYAAAEAPSALKAIVPTCSPPGHAFLNEPLWGGAVLLALAEWMVIMGRRSAQDRSPQGLCSQDQPYFEALPLGRLTELSGTSSPWWAEWLVHPEYDDYWHSFGYEHAWERMAVPALNVTGWWDMNFLGAPRNFVGMRRHGATSHAREGQRLVIGPWAHRVNSARALNGVDFGPSALTDLDGYTLRFFDHWLRGRDSNGLADDARVHVFVVNANQWWAADDWPLPGMQSTKLYLHSNGGANTHRGDGRLSFTAPDVELCDRYTSDPLDPVRSFWNLNDGPVDDRPVSARPDVLCYTSEVLNEAIDVVGPVSAVLYASSSAKDCDWHVRLVDLHPDGSARFLCHGVVRSRFRAGFDRTMFLEPGQIERFDIDMTATGVRFLPGHRIRIEIASSWFSRFDRNPQTDAQNWMLDPTPPVTAEQAVYHEAAYPSHVVLPVIPTAPMTD